MIGRKPSNFLEGDDVFGDVRLHEADQLRQAIERRDVLKAALAAADGVASMQSSSSFQTYQDALRVMLQQRTSALLSAREDREAAVLQGRCIELRTIIDLVSQSQANRPLLAIDLSRAEDRVRELERKINNQPPGEKR